MYKTIFKNSRTRVFTLMLAVAGIISLNILMQSCSKEDEQPLDDAIINSIELEEYIIAGADFQQSLAIFEKELNKIDFSKLEVTYNAEGQKVRHLPAGSVSIRIEEKVQTFNDRKEALRKKFPQFASFGEEMEKKYFQQSIQNSVNVKGKFLELGINISRPLLKSGNESWYGAENQVFLNSYLYNWINSSSYVELYILFYADGRYSTYQHPQATSNWSSITWTVINGQYYFPEGGSSSPVVEVGHTHKGSSSPGTTDMNNKIPGVNNFIYYNWGYHYY